MSEYQMDILDLDMRDAAIQGTEKQWTPPSNFPDLTIYDRIAIDLETRDPNIKTLGPGWCRDDGYIIGRRSMSVTSVKGLGFTATLCEAGEHGHNQESTTFKTAWTSLATSSRL